MGEMVFNITFDNISVISTVPWYHVTIPFDAHIPMFWNEREREREMWKALLPRYISWSNVTTLQLWRISIEVQISLSYICYLPMEQRARVAQWVRQLDYLTTNTSLSPLRRIPARLCKLQKRCTRFAAASDKVYQLLAHGRWFSLASSITNTGRHDIAEILLKVALNAKNLNQNHPMEHRKEI